MRGARQHPGWQRKGREKGSGVEAIVLPAEAAIKEYRRLGGLPEVYFLTFLEARR